MTVLLTGGAGYIGSHTAVELLNTDCNVVIADNLVNSSSSVIDSIEKITGKSVKFYEIDVADKTAMERVFSDNEIDSVIHFAGLKAVGESVSQPLRYYRNNLGSTLTLIEMMEKFSVKNIIFSSSATVYGTPEALPITENMRTGPCTNPYGWTKLMIEQIIGDCAAADKTFSAVLLRYFNPVGAHESGLIGEMPNGIPNNLMPYITQVAQGKLEMLSIFGDDYPTPDGTGVRDYIHVCDLAKGHVSAMKYCAEHTGVETFNLGTGRGCSVKELAETFENVCGVKVPRKIAPRRPGDVAECYSDVSKAKKILGWRAEKTLEDMCRDSWHWQQNYAKTGGNTNG